MFVIQILFQCEVQTDPDETVSDNNDTTMEDNSYFSLVYVPETSIVIDRPYRTDIQHPNYHLELPTEVQHPNYHLELPAEVQHPNHHLELQAELQQQQLPINQA